MIALYDHIQELRAELRGCYMTHRERACVQEELASAVAEQAELRPRIRPGSRGPADTGRDNRGRRLSGPSPSLSAPCSARRRRDGTPRFARDEALLVPAPSAESARAAASKGLSFACE
jgi:hypothetical protein